MISYSRAQLSSITLVGVPHQPRHLQPLPAAAPVSEGTNLELLERTEMVKFVVNFNQSEHSISTDLDQ